MTLTFPWKGGKDARLISIFGDIITMNSSRKEDAMRGLHCAEEKQNSRIALCGRKTACANGLTKWQTKEGEISLNVEKFYQQNAMLPTVSHYGTLAMFQMASHRPLPLSLAGHLLCRGNPKPFRFSAKQFARPKKFPRTKSARAN